MRRPARPPVTAAGGRRAEERPSVQPLLQNGTSHHRFTTTSAHSIAGTTGGRAPAAGDLRPGPATGAGGPATGGPATWRPATGRPATGRPATGRSGAGPPPT